MTEDERELLIKELRMAVLDDINTALNRTIHKLSPDDPRRKAAEVIIIQTMQVRNEIGENKLPRIPVNL